MWNATQAQFLSAVFADQAASRASQPALHFVNNDQSVVLSWGDLADQVYRCVAALHAWGVGRGEHVVHWSPNRPEWVVTDLALNCLGAVHVPLHATLSARQAVDQIVHSESRFAMVAGQDLLQRLAGLSGELSPDLAWCSYDTVKSWQSGQVPQLRQMMAKADPQVGRELAAATPHEMDPDQVSTILYTSGTMGEPKGIMLSQRNLISNATAMVHTFRDQPLEVRLNFLPLSHIFARTCDLYTWLLRGAELALTQNRDTIIDDCKRFKPSVINGVPFFFERVRQKLAESGKADEPGVLLKLFGGELRGCFSGGGALADHTYDYYHQQGIPLLQGYGLTETSPVVSFSTLEQHKRGSAGVAIDGVEICIADDGEILTRGSHVMLGYWKDPAATAQAIQNGWFYTGDLGSLDDDGHLRITGRKKEMIVMSTGKNIFPGQIEELLCRDPLILQAVVVGDRRDCLAALIVPDPDILKAEIKRRRIFVLSRKGAVRNKRVVALFRERIDKQLSQLGRHEQVPLFRVLHHGFTIEAGYMTAKLSLRRSKIEDDFSKLINELYQQV